MASQNVPTDAVGPAQVPRRARSCWTPAVTALESSAESPARTGHCVLSAEGRSGRRSPRTYGR